MVDIMPQIGVSEDGNEMRPAGKCCWDTVSDDDKGERAANVYSAVG